MTTEASPAGASAKPLSETAFALAVTLMFSVVAGLSGFFHEPWRDEAQAWLIARDATGLRTLLGNCRYEGAPALWHLLLLPLTRLGGIRLMAILNLAFAAGAVFLLARHSPFGRRARALFAFGYLPLYEWGTIARSYAVGVFLLFLFAVFFSRRRPLLQGMALAAAANTSTHAAIAATGALALLVMYGRGRAGQPDRAKAGAAIWAGVALAAAGLIVSVLQMLPPAGMGMPWTERASWGRLWSVGYAFRAGFAPFADCWFSAIPGLFPGWFAVLLATVSTGLTALFVATAATCLARRKGAWVMPALSASLLAVLFFYFGWRGPRHAGFLFVAVLLALWLAPLFPERSSGPGRLQRLSVMARTGMARVLTVVLAFHCLAGGLALGVEMFTVFSAARDTAALIRSSGLSALPIAVETDMAAASVVAHLDAPRVYFPNVDRWGSFTVWGDHVHDGEAPSFDDGRVFRRAARLAGEADVIVVVNRSPDEALAARAGAVLIGTRHADVVPDESYWIYRMVRRREIHAIGSGKP